MRQPDWLSGIRVYLHEEVSVARRITNPPRAERVRSLSGPVQRFAGAASAAQPYVTASQSGSPLPISVTSALAASSYPSSNNSRVSLVDPVWHTPLVNGL